MAELSDESRKAALLAIARHSYVKAEVLALAVVIARAYKMPPLAEDLTRLRLTILDQASHDWHEATTEKAQ